jgi:hypothetical protein
MAFKGMTDRFESKMDDIYGKYSARGPEGVGQPFLEIKPNDPTRRETNDDTRLSPNGSFKRDQDRITAFLKSPLGVRFMLSQAELQTGNAFSETRLYNPLFLYGKLTPTAPRIQRSLTSASRGGGDKGDQDIQGVIGSAASGFVNGLLRGTPTAGEDKSPGADNLVGDAGRLQKATAKTATDKVLGRSGPTGLINLLPPNKITRVVSAVKGVLDTGILGINQRPELDIDGQYFSVALWTGFARKQPAPNSFVKAGASLRKGDVKGALISIGKGIVNEVKTRLVGTKAAPIPNAVRSGRNDYSRTDLNGLRYFIVNAQEADRYIQDSVRENLPNIEFMDRLPYALEGKSILFTDTQKTVPRPPVSKATEQQKATTQTDSSKKSFLSKVGGFLKSTVSALVGGATIPGTNIRIGATDPITGRLKTGTFTNNPFSQNPAEERLLFGEMALANQYEEAEGSVKFFKDGLEDQKTNWQESIRKLRTEASYGIGYVGGISPGNTIVDDGGVFASKRTKVDGGRYFSDGAVAKRAIMVNKDVGGVTRVVHPDLKNEIRSAYKDTIDFLFHDYVNNRVIPFKAMLTGIQESVNVDYDSQRYIGRTEKNIVYAGASRELSFTFFIQAFSKLELDFIWQKINYLTGLCFPASYTDGFMVPPFVQLTMGRYYTDQPGYIKSLSHTVEDNTSWDIDENSQMPMGVTVNVGFSVIEKTQVRMGSQFYGFGQPKPIDAPVATVGVINTPTGINAPRNA